MNRFWVAMLVLGVVLVVGCSRKAPAPGLIPEGPPSPAPSAGTDVRTPDPPLHPEAGPVGRGQREVLYTVPAPGDQVWDWLVQALSAAGWQPVGKPSAGGVQDGIFRGSGQWSRGDVIAQLYVRTIGNVTQVLFLPANGEGEPRPPARASAREQWQGPDSAVSSSDSGHCEKTALSVERELPGFILIGDHPTHGRRVYHDTGLIAAPHPRLVKSGYTKDEWKLLFDPKDITSLYVGVGPELHMYREGACA